MLHPRLHPRLQTRTCRPGNRAQSARCFVVSSAAAAEASTSEAAAAALPRTARSHSGSTSQGPGAHAATGPTLHGRQHANPTPPTRQPAQQQQEEEEEMFPVLQLQLPEPTHTKVKSAVYLSSCVKHEDCPPPKYPEFAVIGRSNVGKSSLINMITNSKRLAHVSKEPGKTRCINHFLINGSWYLVDLPGYGYARVGEAQREQFDAFTKQYFLQRPNLSMVLLLIDSTIKPQKVDLEYATWLTDNGVPFCLVFTKTDKRRKGGSSKESNMTEFKRELLKEFQYLPPSIATSAEDGTGKTPLLHFVAALRVAAEQSKSPRRTAPLARESGQVDQTPLADSVPLASP